MGERGVALAVELEHGDGAGVEQLEARDIVAQIVDQLRVARGMRAMRLVDQCPSVGRAVENNRLAPRRSDRLKVAEHGSPGGARMRRFDQGRSEIPKPALALGALELTGV